MKIKLIAVQQHKNVHLDALISDFVKRINHYVKFECIELKGIKNTKGKNQKAMLDAEARMILQKLNPNDHVILLDEKGRGYTSVQFAQKIEHHLITPGGDLVFVIGGPYGFDDSIYKRGTEKMALSSMTFTHQMAKLFFVEQLYRAISILNNLPYHHQ